MEFTFKDEQFFHTVTGNTHFKSTIGREEEKDESEVFADFVENCHNSQNNDEDDWE